MTWSPRKLNDLGAVSRGRSRHRPRDAAHLYDGPYPFVQTGDIKRAGLFLREFTQTYSEAGLRQSKIWPPGTLCITIAANIAETSILSIDACFPDSVIGFIPDARKSDARFVKYLFDATLQKRFKRFTQGTAQDNLSQGKLLSIDFLVPELSAQESIADILSAYDDLIENNKQRIQLLEESARLLYKDWFVHLRFPGHEHAKIKDGMPEGWSSKPLESLCYDVKELKDPSKLPPETPYIGLEHLPRRSITLSEWGTASEAGSKKFEFITGDILFGKIRPYFHKVGVALTNGITSSDAIVIRSKQIEMFNYLTLLLSSDQFIAMASKTMKEGSKMPRADWKLLKQKSFILPPPEILAEFNHFVSPVLQQLGKLAHLNRNLATARDLLLPRLMSGEVAV